MKIIQLFVMSCLLYAGLLAGCAGCADLVAQGRATLDLHPSASAFQKVHVEKEGNETVVHGRARPLASCGGSHVDIVVFGPDEKVLWKQGTELVSRTKKRRISGRSAPSKRFHTFSISIPIELPEGVRVQVKLRCHLTQQHHEKPQDTTGGTRMAGCDGRSKRSSSGEGMMCSPPTQDM